MKNPEIYRPCVGIMLLNQANEVFMAKKTQNIGTEYDLWQMPQGGIEENENLEEGMARELYEETGVKIEDVQILTKRDHEWIYYDIPVDALPKAWNNKYVGQRQKWFLLKAKNDLMVNLNVANEERPEFYIHKWANLEEIIDFSIWFRHDVYKEVLKTFKPFIK